jgi:hypothetical protein
MEAALITISVFLQRYKKTNLSAMTKICCGTVIKKNWISQDKRLLLSWSTIEYLM